MVGKGKFKAFRYVLDRVWEIISNWKTKFLSQAGKEVLIKVVVQSIPSYSMSVFQRPKGLLSDISKMVQTCWWGHHKQNKNYTRLVGQNCVH